MAATAMLYQQPATVIICVCCDQPATHALDNWDVCETHYNALAAPDDASESPEGDDTELVCSGSGQPPRIADGKPHCAVCGQKFKWQEMEDRVRFVPEH